MKAQCRQHLVRAKLAPVIRDPEASLAERLPNECLLVSAAWRLRTQVSSLIFSSPVAHVYNPLDYAWPLHQAYLQTYGSSRKRVVFLGMNPGPFGMVQTGVPFGEVRAVREWLKLKGAVVAPARQHPRRPVTGLDCPRSEISGARLWGLFAARFGAAEDFFAEHFVLNYCPLAFVEAGGRNRTPDKLSRPEQLALFSVCDAHLREAVAALQPDWLIGVGGFAFERASAVFSDAGPTLGRIPHPSPANPAANRGWAGMAEKELCRLGVWTKI